MKITFIGSGKMTTALIGGMKIYGDDIILHLHFQLGAKKTKVVSLHGDALKICLSAPPVDSKENDTLLAFIAAKVGAGRTAVEVISGLTSRAKRVRIHGNFTSTDNSAALLPALH